MADRATITNPLAHLLTETVSVGTTASNPFTNAPIATAMVKFTVKGGSTIQLRPNSAQDTTPVVATMANGHDYTGPNELALRGADARAWSGIASAATSVVVSYFSL